MINQDLIDSAIYQWLKRTTVVIQAQDGHTKH